MATHYSPKIVTDGLVLALDAGNTRSYPGSGSTFTDLSKQQFTGSISGATFSTNNAGYFSFDGINDQIEVASNYNFGGTNKITVISWAKSNSTTWNTAGMLASKRNQYILHPDSESTGIRFYVTISTFKNSNQYIATNIDQWNMWTGVYDGSAIKIYQNTTLGSTNNQTGNISSNTSSLFIGKDDFESRFFNGDIGVTLIYNKALTDSEIAQNYNALKGRFGL